MDPRCPVKSRFSKGMLVQTEKNRPIAAMQAFIGQYWVACAACVAVAAVAILLLMNYPVRTVSGVRCHVHAEVSGFAAAAGSTVECSFVNAALVQQFLPCCWHIRTFLAGIWCVADNNAWAVPAFQNANQVLRAKLEPSNGACRCHGVCGNPAAHANAIIMHSTAGLRAGHVKKEAAEAVGVQLQLCIVPLLLLLCMHLHTRFWMAVCFPGSCCAQFFCIISVSAAGPASC